MRWGGRAGSQEPMQYAGIPVPSTRTGIRPPGMHGRRLAATDSPNAARHSWGRYANPGTAYWYTRVLQWLSQVQVLRCAQDDKAVRVLPFGFAQGRRCAQDDSSGNETGARYFPPATRKSTASPTIVRTPTGSAASP